MKTNYLLAFVLIWGLIFIVKSVNSQGVAVNTDGTNAHTSAMLDVKSSSSGILIPRMTQAQRNAISSPATSLLIFQTDNTPGYYFYNGGAWVRLSAGTDNFDDDDADASNEFQTLSISDHDITLSDGGGTVTVPDNNTTYSAGNQLSLSGTTFNVTEGSGSDLDADLLDGQNGSYYLDNTDNQNISGSGLSGTTLTIGIENGSNQTVDLSSLNNPGTDDQTLAEVLTQGNTANMNIDMNTNSIIDADYYSFINHEWGDFTTDGQLYWDLSAGLYIKSSNAANTNANGRLIWSGANVHEGNNIDFTFDSEDEPTISVIDGSGSGLDADLLDGQGGSYYLDNTDNQNISGSGLSGNTLTIGIENGSNETVDLSSLTDDDWIKGAGTVYNTTDNIGIGTSSPAGILDVTSSGTPNAYIQTSAGSSHDAILHIRGARTTSTTSDIAQIQFEDNANGDLASITARKETSSTNLGNLLFWTTSSNGATPTEKMRLNASGNFGIGTTTPAYKLDVRSSDNSDGAVAIYGESPQPGQDLAGHYTYGVRGKVTSGKGNAVGIYGVSGGGGGSAGRGSGVKGFAGGSTSGYNYGVHGQLESGTGGAAILGRDLAVSWGGSTGGSYAGYFVGDVNIDGDLMVTGTFPSDSRWTLSGSNLYPNSTGWNVGIGTTSPTYLLDVNGEAYFEGSVHQNLNGARIEFESDFSDRDAMYWNQNGTTVWKNFIMSDGDIKYEDVQGGNDFYILPGNNVGIGTSTPSYLLDVNGGLQANNYYADDGTQGVEDIGVTVVDDVFYEFGVIAWTYTTMNFKDGLYVGSSKGSAYQLRSAGDSESGGKQEGLEKSRQISIYDFGSSEIEGTSVWVSFNDKFIKTLNGQIPVITITPTASLNDNYYVSKKTTDGFMLKCSSPQNFTFDWHADARIKTKSLDIKVQKK
jgi:hypothetical protein